MTLLNYYDDFKQEICSDLEQDSDREYIDINITG